MFVDECFQSKQAFRNAVADGDVVCVFHEPGKSVPFENGVTVVEGNKESGTKWRARVRVESGQVVAVLS